jgi:hypothetical protein
MDRAHEPTPVLVARLLDEEARQRAPSVRRPARRPPRPAGDHGVVPPQRGEGETGRA